MPRTYPTFEEMQQRVSDVCKAYHTIQSVEHGILTDKGYKLRDVYETLCECFEFASDKAELVDNVAHKIRETRKDLTPKYPKEPHTPEFISEMNFYIKQLQKYIRFNCPINIWQDYTEIRPDKT